MFIPITIGDSNIISLKLEKFEKMWLDSILSNLFGIFNKQIIHIK